MNQLNMVDSDFVELLGFISTKNFNQNTTVILFGDHGFRMGAYRQTIKGKLEERLPFMSISLPTWFRKQYPQHMKNLRRNSEFLTSHFDIYQTLRHLLYLSNYTSNRDIGKSLFTDFDIINRTCKDAGVPIHYCPCLESKPASNNDVIVHKVIADVISYINKMVDDVTEAKDMCSELTLKEVIRASVIEANQHVRSFQTTYETSSCQRCGVEEGTLVNSPSVIYQMTFSVQPSGGVYETSVEYRIKDKTVSVNSDISRLNLYGKQPDCVAKKHPHLRKYCFCK